EVDVGIAVVHERVEILEGLPDAHAPPIEPEILTLLLLEEVEGLVRMVLSVELPHRAPFLGGKVPERLCGLGGSTALGRRRLHNSSTPEGGLRLGVGWILAPLER